ncbi:MAG: EAL domain-containing protein [Pseudomonas sp.]
MDWVTALQNSLAQGRARLLMQAIIRNEDIAEDRKNVLYNEAILWVDTLPSEPDLSPDQLIPLLECQGLITELDYLVISETISALEEDHNIRLGCNISAWNFSDKCSWWERVYARLRDQPTVAKRLTLEITKTAPIPDFDEAIALIRQLQALNCSIAIDVFGRGYTRLDFVRRIRPDVIKISGDVVQDVDSERAATELRHLVNLASMLTENVVIEGIGSKEKKAMAIAAGAVWLQGSAVLPPAVPRFPITLNTQA